MAFNVTASQAEEQMWVNTPPPPHPNRGRAGFGPMEQPLALVQFLIAGILVVIREGTVRHILEKHEKDFKFEIQEIEDWPTKEHIVATYIKNTIVHAGQLLIADERRSKENSLLIHMRRPVDRMFHRFVITHEAGNLYRLETAFKLYPDVSLLTGYMGRCLVQYDHGVQKVLTAAKVDWRNPHIARVHGCYSP